MKKLISLAIAGLIESAVAQRENGNVEQLAERLSLIVPEDRLEMLVSGVPVNIHIIDEKAFLVAVSKRIHHDVNEIRIRKVEVACDFDGRICYAYKQTRYAKTEEDAKNFNDGTDYWSTSAEQDETYKFPFTAWKADSFDIALNDEQLTKYSLGVEYL